MRLAVNMRQTMRIIFCALLLVNASDTLKFKSGSSKRFNRGVEPDSESRDIGKVLPQDVVYFVVLQSLSNVVSELTRM